MALTLGTVKRTTVATGDDFIVANDGSSQKAQGVAIIGDDGLHAGIAGNPVVTGVEALTTTGSAGALENSRILDASPTTLYSITVNASAVADGWWHVFDAATLPADGATPDWSCFSPKVGTIDKEFAHPLPMAVGCVIARSSTQETLTIDTETKSTFHGQVS